MYTERFERDFDAALCDLVNRLCDIPVRHMVTFLRAAVKIVVFLRDLY